MKKFLAPFLHLSKEIYILFFGRIVTSMGSLIWPLLTLILKNKLGYDATEIAVITMIMSVLQFPMLLLGGKLADARNRKWIIVCCDMVTVVCYIIAGCIPLSAVIIVLFYIAGMFATIEGPSYDALVADLSDGDNREQAYSLQYLGMNLGVVIAPTLGGFLFKQYLWLAFLITAVSTFSSTVLIFFFIKTLSVPKKSVSAYEEKKDGVGLFTILKSRPSLWLYAAATGFGGLLYAQFNYLLPLNMEALYGADGAEIFGLLTSVNGFIVIIATPLVTTFAAGLMDVRKIVCGMVLLALGLFGYRFSGENIPVYFALMIVFTIGEVFKTLGEQPYMTRRIPSTHWGRVNSFIYTCYGAFSAVGNIIVGRILDKSGYDSAWITVGVIGAAAIVLYGALAATDKKQFPLLYPQK